MVNFFNFYQEDLITFIDARTYKARCDEQFKFEVSGLFYLIHVCTHDGELFWPSFLKICFHIDYFNFRIRAIKLPCHALHGASLFISFGIACTRGKNACRGWCREYSSISSCSPSTLVECVLYNKAERLDSSVFSIWFGKTILKRAGKGCLLGKWCLW